MDSSTTYCETLPLLRIVNYILDSVDHRGAWGGGDFEDWTPTITALTLELLLGAGFAPETDWVVVRGTKLEHVCLTKTIDYLNACIRSDGKFGEDIWDAARFGRIVEEYNLKDRVQQYPQLKKYVLDYTSKGLLKNTDHTWAGPGSIAAVIDYLDVTQEAIDSNELFRELLTLQFEDGSFHGPVNEVNDEIVHPIWHTSQVLMTSLRHIHSEKDSRLKKTIDFICNCQDRTKGCWRAFSRYDVYFTAYAIMALNKLSIKPREVLDRAILWICGQVAENGKVRDAGGTIMAAMALFAQVPGQLEFKATLADIRRMDKAELVVKELNITVSELKAELKKNKHELREFQDRYNGADIVLSKADVFRWAILLGVISILVSFAMGVVPSFFSSKQPQIIYIKPEQPQENAPIKQPQENTSTEKESQESAIHHKTLQ